MRLSFGLIAFLLAAWMMASLALTDDVVRTSTPINIGPLAVVLVASASDIFLTFGIILLSLVLYWIVRDRNLLAKAIGNLLSKRRGADRPKRGRSLKRDLIGIVIFVGFFLFVRTAGLLPPSQAPKGGTNSTGSSLSILSGLNGQIFHSSLLEIYHFFAIWAFQIVWIAIAAISGVVLFQGLSQVRAERLELSNDDSTVATETVSVLESSTQELEMGDDPRRGILECYRQLCLIFDSRGEKTHRLLTARELQVRMIRQLNSAERPISDLTCLFEEARYSQHSISVEMKDKAIGAMQEIKNCLRHPSESTLSILQ